MIRKGWLGMTLPHAVVIAAAIIGIALLVTLRWQVSGQWGSGRFPVLLDRWTGNVGVCASPPSEDIPASGGFWMHCPE
jgi:hypothetical protein